MNSKIFTVVVLGLLGIGAYLSIFIVDQREIAIKLKFGAVVKVYMEPGLHFMIPFVNDIRKFDRRLLDLDEQPKQVFTGEQKQVKVDYYVKWRINTKDRKGEKPGTNVIRFYTANSGSIELARLNLSSILESVLNSEFGSRTVSEVISKDRVEVMRNLKIKANEQVQSKGYGIEVVDVRIKQIEYQDDTQANIYRLMIQERQQRSTQHRAEGKAKATRIRAISEKEATIIMAQAKRTALKLKGEGDGMAAKIYAQAHNKNREFYAFYRTLRAYEKTFSEKDVMILDPKSEFFRYFDVSKVK